MRPDPVELSLGDQSFKIRPLTLRQLRGLEDASLSREFSRETDRLIQMLRIVLERDHENAISDDLFLDLEAWQLLEAVTNIQVFAGMKAARPGEAQAARPGAASSGDAATDA